ncbi:MAG: hypothetical protein WA669_23115, partial [Pseudolabrys sp.]
MIFSENRYPLFGIMRTADYANADDEAYTPPHFFSVFAGAAAAAAGAAAAVGAAPGAAPGA